MIRLTEREQIVWDKRNAGLTFKQIAEDLGLCVQTVSFAYRKAYRKIEHEKERLKPTELEVYKMALELVSAYERKYDIEKYTILEIAKHEDDIKNKRKIKIIGK